MVTVSGCGFFFSPAERHMGRFQQKYIGVVRGSFQGGIEMSSVARLETARIGRA